MKWVWRQVIPVLIIPGQTVGWAHWQRVSCVPSSGGAGSSNVTLRLGPSTGDTAAPGASTDVLITACTRPLQDTADTGPALYNTFTLLTSRPLRALSALLHAMAVSTRHLRCNHLVKTTHPLALCRNQKSSYTMYPGCHPLVDTYAPQPVHSPCVGSQPIIGC